ncbi:phosphate ABC transporter permease PstA [Archaeoglobus veneficus]|uniref:Phosphate transport system permease protein PstA n=1 Tax=Archaeoglobus veneficus (strain DSM 11195 / SNP6) TaxID=693661 RepID=F2KSB3_ARCVS|nr:phosphate ABC transporter permease PstA [Archaeoglobus veneficus]AEA46882.1 phosphate ABC transporter, inner membrane subunit PstA [Archaeoglobus veneficus SNP6]
MKTDKIVFAIFRLVASLTIAFLLFVILYIVKEGIGVINLKFLTANWEHRDITKGGIFPAILGTIYVTVMTAVFSIPLGVGAAIFLNEYARAGRTVRLIKMAIRNLAGVPSVVYGLFGLAAFVYFFGFGESIIAASLTLAVMTLPWVITSSEEALKGVPNDFRLASYALGATKWQTIKNAILPYALPGVLTGAIIGLARAMGETAPLLFTGAVFYIRRLPNSPFDRFMSLPYHTYVLATQHASPYAKTYAAATATVLIAIVFIMIASATIIRYRYRKARRW